MHPLQTPTILFETFSYLRHKELHVSSQVCKNWRTATELFWKSLCQRHGLENTQEISWHATFLDSNRRFLRGSVENAESIVTRSLVHPRETSPIAPCINKNIVAAHSPTNGYIDISTFDQKKCLKQMSFAPKASGEILFNATSVVCRDGSTFFKWNLKIGNDEPSIIQFDGIYRFLLTDTLLLTWQPEGLCNLYKLDEFKSGTTYSKPPPFIACIFSGQKDFFYNVHALSNSTLITLSQNFLYSVWDIKNKCFSQRHEEASLTGYRFPSNESSHLDGEYLSMGYKKIDSGQALFITWNCRTHTKKHDFYLEKGAIWTGSLKVDSTRSFLWITSTNSLYLYDLDSGNRLRSISTGVSPCVPCSTWGNTTLALTHMIDLKILTFSPERQECGKCTLL